MNSSVNRTDQTVQGWTSSPDQRGTVDIIFSCFLTILLCCWTSVCPNIPAKEDKRGRKLQHKISLAGIGLLGPELLLVMALGQWSSARRSVKVIGVSLGKVYLLTTSAEVQSFGFRQRKESVDPHPCFLRRHGRYFTPYTWVSRISC